MCAYSEKVVRAFPRVLIKVTVIINGLTFDCFDQLLIDVLRLDLRQQSALRITFYVSVNNKVYANKKTEKNYNNHKVVS